ncbi:hypothetical protein [Streptomyces halobius]|uniref:Uncharacterized protein n=1 Tax=Streptomyces halobius TaxID=2879846 RepID=A0ABY4M376_9ACTN|nr:hypothetical protein [Streptomyces halobius]UQA91668.1 hypothetical protein K9S39_07140 [Streptomyces halobius]
MPLPSESGIYEVTPGMASSWFSFRATHPKLRSFSKSTAARYQADMEAGRWREATPEGLIFDTSGYVISAQHRLRAQANAGVTLKWRIFVNEPRDIAPYLEQARRRTAGDLIQVKYRTQLGAGARHLAALADGDRWGLPRYNKVSVVEVVDTYEKWPELGWFIADVARVQTDAGVPAGPHAAVLAQAARTGHRDKIPEWLRGIRTGENLSGGDPRLHLARRFRNGLQSLSQVNKRDYSYAVIAKAWNDYTTDVSMTMLTFRVGEPLPKVQGFDFNPHRKEAA